MRNYIFFLIIILASAHSNGMNNPNNSAHQHIECVNIPVWRPNSHELILQKGITYPVKKDPQNPAKLLPADGPLTYTCLYNASTNTQQLLEAGNELFNFSDCSQKGTYLAALTPSWFEFSTNIVHVWNLITTKKLAQFKTTQTSFKISPQENYIACESGDNKSFLVRSLATNAIICSLTKKALVGKTIPTVYVPTIADSCAFSSDDRYLAYEDCFHVQIIDLSNPQNAPIIIQGHTPRFADPNFLMIHNAASLYLYNITRPLTDPKNGAQTYALEHTHTNALLSGKLQFGKSLDRVIVLDKHDSTFPQQRTGTLLEPVHGFVFNLIKGSQMRVRNIQAVSADFSLIAFGEGSIRIKAMNNLDELGYEHCTPINILHAFFSPNNQYYFAESATTILVWDFQRGTSYLSKESLRGFPLVRSSCSPDSKYLLVRAEPGKARLYNLAQLDYKKIN